MDYACWDPYRPASKTIKVKLYVYKNTRVASLVKHTGLYFEISGQGEPAWYCADYGPASNWGSVSSAPAPGAGAAKVRIPDLSLFLKHVEESVFACKFAIDADEWDKILSSMPTSEYHFSKQNCRHFCFHVLARLQLKAAVAEEALTFLKRIHINDGLIGAAFGFGTLIASAVAFPVTTFGGVLLVGLGISLPKDDNTKAKSNRYDDDDDYYDDDD